ncbi:MAG: hypothetical protein ACMVP2_18805 [Imperialibacter sp.]|uniref:hypothetical protein n=1 Tax=Imperialibacter sp. TaxID=2038411 RepID=UPI003A87A205
MTARILVILGMAASSLYGQNILRSPTYFEMVPGAYELQSTSPRFSTTAKIDAQLEIERIQGNTGYIVPPKNGVTLFKNSSPKSSIDVAGRLYSNSIIELFEIEYRTTYQNPDTTWKFSHEVWYKIFINGQVYFTDFRVHELEMARQLPKFSQDVALAFQDTGYDYFYDNGYPEHFHFLAFKKTAGGLVLEFDSQELDFKCDCEFWELDTDTYEWKILDNGSLFIKLDGYKDSFVGTWDGRSLTKE